VLVTTQILETTTKTESKNITQTKAHTSLFHKYLIPTVLKPHKSTESSEETRPPTNQTYVPSCEAIQALVVPLPIFPIAKLHPNGEAWKQVCEGIRPH
jgi:hypothetical protein